MSLHPDILRFASALRKLETHLRTNDAPHWANDIARCAAWIEQSDYNGVERFLRLFGGMGSLNDLILHRNGQMLTIENDELRTLLTRSYEMADGFRRERL
ncbi:DUF6966 domain-containing protein [Rhizobium sp. HT1-10]|uniref:DUF6966 domain-containing protein n=1 Tax=Rhizobium sp. HT1-10 TaxID=3111638 RepID=UPI003C1C9601